MDPRVFNASITAGLLLVSAGVGMQFSWPAACIVAGTILLVGAFRSAALTARRG